MSPATPLVSFLGFVFVYNNTFMMGFLNYNFGILFLFLAIAALMEFSRGQTRIRATWLFLSMTCLFFSHLIMFCVFGLFALAFFIASVIIGLTRKEKVWFWNARTIFYLLFATLLPMLLLIIYLFSAKGDVGYTYSPPSKIIHDILRQSGSYSISEHEDSYLRWNWIIPLSGLCLAMVIQWLQYLSRNKRVVLWSPKSTEVSVFVFVFFLLIAIFKLPDSTASGSGLLTERLIFQCTTFFLIGVILSFRSKFILLPILLALLYVSIDRLMFIHRELNRFQEHCSELMNVSNRITDDGCLTVFDFSDIWVTNHYTSHIATEHNLVVFDNWSNKSYTSVLWKDQWKVNDDLDCWQKEQWHCDLYRSEAVLGQKIGWFLVLNETKFIETVSPAQFDWQVFFSDSCDVAYQQNREIILYRRKGL